MAGFWGYVASVINVSIPPGSRSADARAFPVQIYTGSLAALSCTALFFDPQILPLDLCAPCRLMSEADIRIVSQIFQLLMGLASILSYIGMSAIKKRFFPLRVSRQFHECSDRCLPIPPPSVATM